MGRTATVTRRFADATTFHAIKDLYDAQIGGKAFWSILLVTAIVGFCLQLQDLVTTYIRQDTGATLAQFNPEVLPAISICPDNWVSKEKADKYNITDGEITIINGFLPQVGTDEILVTNRLSTELKSLFAKEEARVRGLLSEKFDETVSKLIDAIRVDSVQGFVAVVYPSAVWLRQEKIISWGGVCYKFSSNESLNYIQMSFAGMMLDIQGDKSRTMSPSVITSDPRFRVFLSVPGQADVKTSGDATFDYGSHYVLSWSTTSVKRVDTRAWPCRKWSVSDSFACIVDHGNALCRQSGNCQSPLTATDAYEETKGPNICNAFTNIDEGCLKKTGLLKYTDQKWNQICPRPCEFQQFQYTHQQRGLHDFGQARMEIKAVGGMGGQKIEEHLIMDAAQLMSNIGGTLGLWMGASVLTIAQVVYLFCLSDILNRSKTTPVQEIEK